MTSLVVLIVIMPLGAAILTAVLGPRLLRELSHVPAVTATGISLLASVVLLWMSVQYLQQHRPGESPRLLEQTVQWWTWAEIVPSGAATQVNVPHGTTDYLRFQVPIVLRVDTLTIFMLVTVSCVSFLVAIYSIGYMRGDPGYWRFYTYICLFVFSMLMLVSVSNFLLLYVFWEAVGLCSYLLIGFWYRKPAAAAAGKKAFLVNRVGDFGFALGIFLIWSVYGTLNFHDVIDPQTGEAYSAGVLGMARLVHPERGLVQGGIATAICLLLFAGACGKSAQFPLHVWLPDAMEGPTPVSALIHAATMVTAGVYMVARCMPLFHASPYALPIVGIIATLTAAMAAIIALTQTDLKRILAYSTISQLGYMFLGLSVGGLIGVAAAMFHLFTHAFFKALLFLGAGSVMHATDGVIDIREIGGLRRRLPWTHATFLVGSLALAGLCPFAGFFSKDEILQQVHQLAGTSSLFQVLFVVAMATACLTAIYTFRAYFRTFFGEERLPGHAAVHAQESPSVMVVPLVILAVGAAAAGLLLGPGRVVERYLAATPSLAAFAPRELTAQPADHFVPRLSSILTVLGIAWAAVLVLGPSAIVNPIVGACRAVGLYSLSWGKFFLDELYQAVIVRPLEAIAALAAWFDRYVIDFLVDLMGFLPKLVGALIRGSQSGWIPWYSLGIVFGVLVLLAVMIL